MKKILVLPLLLCLIFCSFLSLDKNLDEFDPDRTAYGSYDHRVVWGSYASSDKAALPQQEVLDSRAVLYSESDMTAGKEGISSIYWQSMSADISDSE